jgi:hypothetical protein
VDQRCVDELVDAAPRVCVARVEAKQRADVDEGRGEPTACLLRDDEVQLRSAVVRLELECSAVPGLGLLPLAVAELDVPCRDVADDRVRVELDRAIGGGERLLPLPRPSCERVGDDGVRRGPPRRELGDALCVPERPLALLDVEARQGGQVVRVRVVGIERDQADGGRVRRGRVDVELDAGERVEQLAVVRLGGEGGLQQPDRLLGPTGVVQRGGAEDDVAAIAQTSFLCFRYARRSS